MQDVKMLPKWQHGSWDFGDSVKSMLLFGVLAFFEVYLWSPLATYWLGIVQSRFGTGEIDSDS